MVYTPEIQTDIDYAVKLEDVDIYYGGFEDGTDSFWKEGKMETRRYNDGEFHALTRNEENHRANLPRSCPPAQIRFGSINL